MKLGLSLKLLSSVSVLSPIWKTQDALIDFDFKNGRYFGPQITVQRASTAYAIDADGIYQPFAPNTMRREYTPKTPRTNMCPFSQTIADSTWIRGNVTVTGDADVAPDGTLTAARIRETTANALHQMTRPVTGLTSGATYTFSVYAKAEGRTRLHLGSFDGTTGVDAFFNLTTGTVISGPGTITPAGNGWFRCAFTRVINNTTINNGIYFDNGANNPYVGDTTLGGLLWGAQHEVGSVATKYIKTDGFAVTVDAPRTNWIRNNTVQGLNDFNPTTAVPSLNTCVQAAGLTRTFTKQVRGGRTGLLVELSGTTTSSAGFNYTFDGALMNAPAVQGQVWTTSVNIQIDRNIGYVGFGLEMSERSGDQTQASSGNVQITKTDAPYRAVYTRQLSSVGTAAVIGRVVSQTVGIGTIIDVAFWIADAQLEQNGIATDIISTYGVAETVDTERRNWIRNNTCQGVSLGIIGSGGSCGNNYFPNSTTGMTREVVAKGVDADGNEYFDIKVYGTNVQTGANLPLNLTFENINLIPAANGETWTVSGYFALIDGTLPGIYQLALEERSSSANVKYNATTFNGLDSTLRRFQRTFTLSGGANVSSVAPSLWVYGPTSAGVEVNFTIRVALCQCEQRPSMSNVIKTYGTARSVGPGAYECNGLLAELASENKLRNNSMQGAIIGTTTLPTFWSSTNSPTITIMDIGVEGGIDYADFRIQGNSNVALEFESTTSIPCVPGQLWTSSFFYKYISGSMANLTVQNAIQYQGDVTIPTADLDMTYTGPLLKKRSILNATVPAGSASTTRNRLRVVTSTSGTFYDFTIRIGWPQLERWDLGVTTVGGSTSPIRTTNGVGVRAADQITCPIPSTKFGPNATMAALIKSPKTQIINSTPLNAGDTVNNNRLKMYGGATGWDLTIDSAIAGANQTGVLRTGFQDARQTWVGTWEPGKIKACVNGGTVSEQASVVPTQPMTTLYIGCNMYNGLQPTFGYVERIAIFDRTFSNTEVQTLGTTLLAA